MSEYSDTALHIMNTAKELFSEKGFKGVSTKKIAQAAEVNEVTLFRLFGSKAKLLDAVMEHCLFRPNFGVLLEEPSQSLEDFLRRLGQFLNQFMKKNQTLIKIELMNLGYNLRENKLSRFPHQVRAVLIQEFITYKGLSPEQAHIEAVTFMTAIHGLCLNLYILPTLTEQVSFEECLESLVAKFSATVS